MRNDPLPTAQSGPGGGRRRAPRWLFPVVAGLVLLSCDPTVRHRVLTYFFDGVPPLESASDAATDPAAAAKEDRVALPPKVVHWPFQERKCDLCHDTGRANTSRAEGQSLCFQEGCHGDEMVRRRYTHGPVTSRQCDECHAPHESPFASLLVRRGDDLCLYCHGEETIVEGAKVMRLAGGSHVNFPKEDCTGCHDPHGSDVSATLLKPGVPLPSEGAKTP